MSKSNAKGKPAPTKKRKPKSSTKCGAKKRNGGKCGLDAGHGTDHVGQGNCKHHGGSTPNGVKHAARLQAVAVHAELALLVDMDISNEDPLDGLLLAYKITRMEVIWYTQRIALLELDEVTLRPLKEESVTWGGPDGGYTTVELAQMEQANLWIQLREKSVDRLAKYSKMAIDAGIDERRLKHDEQYADVVSRLLGGVVADLQALIPKDQQHMVEGIVTRHLAKATLQLDA